MIDETQDNATIYSDSDFGQAAVFDVSGTDLEVNGIFTNATEAANLLTGEVEVYDASISCPSAETASVRKGMTVTIGGTEYTIERKQILGTGDTLFYLKT